MAKILIVDDSTTVLTFTSMVLRQAGYEVRTSNNVWISSEVASFQPDLILIDVNMRGACSGTTVVEALRDCAFAVQTVFVLYSSLVGEELEALVVKCGAHGCIHKTADEEVLRCQVHGFLPSR